MENLDKSQFIVLLETSLNRRLLSPEQKTLDAAYEAVSYTHLDVYKRQVEEYQQNNANLQLAIQTLDGEQQNGNRTGDVMGTRVWWDCKSYNN